MNPSFLRRRNLRLAGFDYSSEGAYFVTICSYRKVHLFGEITDDTVSLNDAGKIVHDLWSGMFRWAEQVPTWIVMLNHLHGVIAITEESNRPRPLGQMIAAFKALSTKRINQMRGIRAGIVWQRNFYEHIIRNERSLERILSYIEDNPSRWSVDPENAHARE